jgi:DNA polymerase III alpha subunit (gram-positive type)
MAQHKLITKDTIISFDIETTGLVGGIHSMIALGAVAYRDGKEVSHFYGCLKEWDGSERDVDTMLFWQRNRAEWDRIRKESRDPQEVMQEFAAWVDTLPAPRTLAAWPASFDTAFLFFYLEKFVGGNIVNRLFERYRALDIRSFVSCLLAVPYSEAERKLLPQEWKENTSYTHNALDDARQQGVTLMNILKASVGELELGA